MTRLTLVLLLLITGLTTYSQRASIKGKITDTAEKKNLTNSVVSLLRTSDSSFVKFTRSDKDGNFQLSNIPAGKYFLLITHPTFADFYQETTLTDTTVQDFGQVPMILRSQLLEQVVVSQKLGAIRLKKDTTEYIADSFKVAANANVEDLLKRLPGIQVGADGKIKAQGEDVQKVLVDGEEFFGDDPTMATQNIRADAVEKVQVFDKKSDQAAFTGIDDGQRTKTINLKLKEDKKNGYFGKISLGGGLSDKFSNQAMINLFKGKRKIAAFGIMSNTGRTGLGWGDRNAYGGGDNNTEIMDDGSGMIMMYSSGDDFDGGGGSYYGEGLPTSWSAGLHHSNKYDGDKHKVNFNYRFNKLNTIGSGSTISQFNQGIDSFLLRKESGSNFSQRLRNSLSGTYEVQLDSSSSLKFTLNGSIGKTESANYLNSESQNSKGALLNASQRSQISKADNQNLNSSLIWRKRFKKIGRTISINGDLKYSDNNSNGFLNSSNEVFGSVNRKDSVDQKKFNGSKRNSISGKVSYTEPLTKRIVLEINYGLAVNNSESERLTFDKKNDKYDQMVDSLSSDYAFDILTNSGGLNLRVNKKSYNFSFGGNINNASFKQTNMFTDSVRTYSYFNFFPRANFNWNIKPQTRFGIRYNGNTRQPTIDQLQPLKDNTDQYNIRKGNPDLKQEFRHSFDLNFNDFKVMNNRGIWAFASFSTTTNAISSSDFIDTLGRRVSQPVNVNGNYNYNTYLSYGFKLKKSDFNLGFDLNTNGYTNNSLMNNKKNRSQSNGYEFGVNANYRKDKKAEFWVRLNQAYNTTKSSLNPQLANNYWSTNINANGTVYLPWKTELWTNVDVQLRQKTPLFPDRRNVVLWKASASKKIFKDESAVIKFEMSDLLNQNKGVSRDVGQDGTITQRTYETIRRFWLLSFTWNFSKNGKAPSNPWD